MGAADANQGDGVAQHALLFEKALLVQQQHRLLDVFVRHGADLDVKDAQGRTVLQYAASNDQPDTAVGLVLNGKSRRGRWSHSAVSVPVPIVILHTNDNG